MMSIYKPIAAQIRRLLARPSNELSHAQRTLQWSLDLGQHCAHELREDRASQMAAALTYRTIFGLVPFFVLSLVVFNAFGGFESVGEDVQDRIYKYLGISSISLTDQDKQQLVQEILNDLNNRVASVSFTSIGVVGLAILIWAALSLVVTVEQCFNRIYNRITGRVWRLRIAIYWAVITLGPVLLMASLYITSQVVGQAEQMFSEHAEQWFGAGMVGTANSIVNWLSQFTAVFVSWVLLFLLYSLMPNTTVRLGPALTGSIVAAVLWEIAKYGFKFYLTNAVGYSALYGSLGLIPMFLFWIYVTWLIVLFGLELTYTLQTMDGRRFKNPIKQDRDLIFDPRWVIPMLAVVGEAFLRGQTLTAKQIARKLSLPIRVVGKLGEHLQNAGFLYRLTEDEDGDPGYSLACPPNQILIKQLLNIVQNIALTERTPDPLPGQKILANLSAAEQGAISGMTLQAVLVNPRPGAEPIKGTAPLTEHRSKTANRK